MAQSQAAIEKKIHLDINLLVSFASNIVYI